jgi:hypothetical protein
MPLDTTPVAAPASPADLNLGDAARRPTRGWMLGACILTAVQAVAAAAFVFDHVSWLNFDRGRLNGLSVPSPKVAMPALIGILEGPVRGWYVALGFASLVVVLCWLYRAYYNLPALGVSPKGTPRAAVLWWLVPVANVFMPVPYLLDLTLGSAALSALVLAWWVTRMAGGLVSIWARFALAHPQTLEDFANYRIVYTGIEASTVLQCILAVAVLVGLQSLHEQRVRDVRNLASLGGPEGVG